MNQDNNLNMQQPMNQMPNQQMNMQQPMNQMPNQQMNVQQPMNQMPNQQMNMQQPMNQMPNQQTVLPKGVDNNALLEAYIGKNFNKFITKKFNFSGFFFTTTYMAYRGMYLHAVAYFIIANLIGFIIRFPALKLLSAIIVGTFVNKIYLMHVNKSIDKIKINNSGKNTEELKQICAKKGGRNFWIALVVCIIFSAISFNLPNPIDPIATIRIGDTEETESFDEDSNITITETQDA